MCWCCLHWQCIVQACPSVHLWSSQQVLIAIAVVDALSHLLFLESFLLVLVCLVTLTYIEWGMCITCLIRYMSVGSHAEHVIQTRTASAEYTLTALSLTLENIFEQNIRNESLKEHSEQNLTVIVKETLSKTSDKTFVFCKECSSECFAKNAQAKGWESFDCACDSSAATSWRAAYIGGIIVLHSSV